MPNKSGSALVFITLLLCCQNKAQAQNVQNFVNNEENRIQQDANSGALNAKQSAAIQNKQAQIMYQEQQYKNMNGGNLTAQEQGQIAHEERGLTKRVNQNVYQNTGSSSNGGWLSRAFSGLNQNNTNNVPPANWRGNWNQGQVNPNFQPNQYTNPYYTNQNGNPYPNQYGSPYTNQNGNYYGQPYRYHRQWPNN